MSGALLRLDPSPRAAARRGVAALVIAALVELAIVAVARAADWPAGAFYTVSALSLAILVAVLVPIIEPPRSMTDTRSDLLAEVETRMAVAQWLKGQKQQRALIEATRRRHEQQQQLRIEAAQHAAEVKERAEARTAALVAELRVALEEALQEAALLRDDPDATVLFRVRLREAFADHGPLDPKEPLTRDERVAVTLYVMRIFDSLDEGTRVEVGDVLARHWDAVRDALAE